MGGRARPLHRCRNTPSPRETDRRGLPFMALVLWYHDRYRPSMAVNLRLPADLAERLRRQAEAEGRSQQSLLRDAVAHYLDDAPLSAFPPHARARLLPAARPFSGFRELPEDLRLPSEQAQRAMAELRGDR